MAPVLAVLAAAVLFGTTGTSQALAPSGATVFSLGAVRLALGGTGLAVVAFLLARRTGAHPPARMTAKPALLMILTGVCLSAYQPLFFLGTSRGGVAVGTAIAIGSAPVLAGIGEWIFLRRRPRLLWVVATALATAGVVVLGVAGGGQGPDALGVIGSVGAGLSFAVLAVAQRSLLDAGWNAFTLAGVMGAVCAVVGFGMVPFVDLTWVFTARGAVVSLWLGLATLAVGYVLFTWGLQGLAAATAATLVLAEPLTAGLLGVLVLGEHLQPVTVAGLATLAVGLVLLAFGSRVRPAVPAALGEPD